MAYDEKLDGTNGECTPQTFKINGTMLSYRHDAYDSEEMQKLQQYFDDVLEKMEEANEAIDNSGIEGISKVNLAFGYTDTSNLEDKRGNLVDFTAGAYDDADEKIEDPFYQRIYNLMRATEEHRTFSVTYNGNSIEIPYDYSTPENILTWMMTSVDNMSADDVLYTDDEETNELIKTYMSYDVRTGTYGFEAALADWDNLSEKEQATLAHCYEYSYRQYEMVVDENSYGAKEKHEIVQRMANSFVEHQEPTFGTDYLTPAKNPIKMSSPADLIQTSVPSTGYTSPVSGSNTSSVYNGYMTVSAAGKGMLDYLGEDSRGRKFVEDLNSKGTMMGNQTITVSHEGAATVFKMSPKDGVSSVNYNMSPASLLTGTDITISYCTSDQRSQAYVFYQAEKNPGMYAHQKELGINLYGVASILTAAENPTDMEVLENLSRNTGNYYDVFTKSAGVLSDSANDKILEYVVTMQSMYNQTKSYTYERELTAINSFYGDTENGIAQGYWDRYFDLVKANMTQEEKVDLYISTDYVMSEEEAKEAYDYASKELKKYMYDASKNGYVDIATGEVSEYASKLKELEIKASAVQSFASSFCMPYEHLKILGDDLDVEIRGTLGEIGGDAIDDIFGTDYGIQVRNWEYEKFDEFDKRRDALNHTFTNSMVQHPIASGAGYFFGNALLYYATGPIFEGMAGAVGVESGLGLFVANQACQNVQDLVLDTSNLYARLTADGELSADDVKELEQNMALNAGVNLFFGSADAAVKAFSDSKSIKVADELLTTYKLTENSADFLKGLDNSQLSILVRNLEPEEAAKVLSRFSGETVDSVLKTLPDDAGKAVKDIMKGTKSGDAAAAAMKTQASEVVADVIKNTETSANGAKLTGDALEANNVFRGDNFKAADSFNNSIDAAKRAELVDNNTKLTCPVDGNLDGALKSNPDIVEPSAVKELEDLRSTVPEVTGDTVLQKVIPKDTVEKLLSGEWNTVRGCTAKASDAAPFTGTPGQIYKNLRMDYAGNPYKAIVENGDEVYILRYTTDDVPTNLDYPKLDPNYGPPCTESGFLGSPEVLIPEYTHINPAKITDGAIYKLNPDGSEQLVCYWDIGKQRMLSAENGKPYQMHHFATNKNKTYTPQFEDIANKYGLDLDDAWNKEYMPHQGRHPNEYHEYVLDNMIEFDKIAQGDKNIFINLYEKMKMHITDNPDMLYKDYWKNGEH
ncbi:A nuclease family of the HNH/ENDO VII superfamily with conserved AHH [Butyrivibrio hungatei DSM 14810]|uniref:A nuclease family of the HNH/ENDO VII superfamily with conserved AHH n=1 Tax=Butyrivibrio hungatei DSM 14810 TaxID=1121132 RepID=A0A1M7RSF8_9FIRM|nr:AHH domain-containing protein [Butyrivibrio hungatei]SHN49056.1 A nuclease family of the HNH/ENDO VII superfamily with conserved AHH [Butyrivibrio hungatei DSM 14810]